jgi:hypothetical protein
MEDAEIKEEREKENAADEREKQRIQNWAEKESIENWAKAMLKSKEQELHAEGERRRLTGSLTDSLDSNVVSLPFLHSDSEAEVEDVEDVEEEDERAPPPRLPPRALFNPAQSYQENRVRDYQNHFPTAYSREYVESAAGFDASDVASEVRFYFYSLYRNGCMQSCKVQLGFFPLALSLFLSLSISLSPPPPLHVSVHVYVCLFCLQNVYVASRVCVYMVCTKMLAGLASPAWPQPGICAPSTFIQCYSRLQPNSSLPCSATTPNPVHLKVNS